MIHGRGKNMVKTETLLGKEAMDMLDKILEETELGAWEYKYKGSFGIFREDNKFIAFDNNTGDCWVEEFETLKDAIEWLNEEV